MSSAFIGTVAEFRDRLAESEAEHVRNWMVESQHDLFREWLRANEAELMCDFREYLDAAAENADPRSVHTWGTYTLERYLELPDRGARD